MSCACRSNVIRKIFSYQRSELVKDAPYGLYVIFERIGRYVVLKYFFNVYYRTGVLRRGCCISGGWGLGLLDFFCD